MIIQCNSCGQRYNLDESKIPGRGARVTCPSCKTKFVVMKPGQGSDDAAAPQPSPAQSNPQTAPPPAPAPAGIRSWQVRVASGLIYDFTDVATLKSWLVEGKVTQNDQISADGTTWTPIARVGDLEAFFSQAPAPTQQPPQAQPPAQQPPVQQPPVQQPPVQQAAPQQGGGQPPPASAAANNPLAAAFSGPSDPFEQFNTDTDAEAAPAPPTTGDEHFDQGTQPGTNGSGKPAVEMTAPASPQAPAPPPAQPQAPQPPAATASPAAPGATGSASPAPPMGGDDDAIPIAPPPGSAAEAAGADPFGGPDAGAPPPGEGSLDLWGETESTVESPEPRTGASTTLDTDLFDNPEGTPTGVHDQPPGAASPGGAPDPFAAGGAPPPPAPAPGGNPDPFASDGPPSPAPSVAGGADPFANNGPPSAAPSPPAGNGPDPFASAGPASIPSGPPVAQSSNPFVDESERVQMWDEPEKPTAPAQQPAGAPAPRAKPVSPQKRPGGGGRRVVLLLIPLVLILAAAAGAYVFRDRLQPLLDQVMARINGEEPAPTPPPRNVELALDGQARDTYLVARRLSRMADPDAQNGAVDRFAKVTSLAENNPLALAGVLQSLSIRKMLGGEVPDEELQAASASATQAWRDLTDHPATNRARGAYYLASGNAAQAVAFLDTAVERNPEDGEALALRGLAKLSSDQTVDGLADLNAALETDRQLTWGYQLALEHLKGRDARRARNRLSTLRRQDEKARSAITNDMYQPNPDEVAVLLPVEPTASPAPTPVVDTTQTPEVTATAQPTQTRLAVVTPNTPAPTPTATRTTVVTQTPVATTRVPTPTPFATPTVVNTATPVVTSTPVTTATPEPTQPPASPTPTEESITANAKDYYVAGRALIQAGDPAGAIEELENAVRLQPNNPVFHAELGWAHYQNREPTPAVRELEQAVRLNQMLPIAHRRLGYVFESLSRYPEACIHFDNYLRLAPTANDAAKIQTRRRRMGCGG